MRRSVVFGIKRRVHRRHEKISDMSQHSRSELICGSHGFPSNRCEVCEDLKKRRSTCFRKGLDLEEMFVRNPGGTKEIDRAFILSTWSDLYMETINLMRCTDNTLTAMTDGQLLNKIRVEELAHPGRNPPLRTTLTRVMPQQTVLDLSVDKVTVLKNVYRWRIYTATWEFLKKNRASLLTGDGFAHVVNLLEILVYAFGTGLEPDTQCENEFVGQDVFRGGPFSTPFGQPDRDIMRTGILRFHPRSGDA